MLISKRLELYQEGWGAAVFVNRRGEELLKISLVERLNFSLAGSNRIQAIAILDENLASWA